MASDAHCLSWLDYPYDKPEMVLEAALSLTLRAAQPLPCLSTEAGGASKLGARCKRHEVHNSHVSWTNPATQDKQRMRGLRCAQPDTERSTAPSMLVW